VNIRHDGDEHRNKGDARKRGGDVDYTIKEA
jgi:hypothetical protein